MPILTKATRARRGTYRPVLAVLIAAAMLSFVPGCTGEKKEAGKTASRTAPPLRVEVFGGGVFDLDEKRGALVVLNFWASWCGPCKAEAPELERVYRRFRDKGVFFMAVAVDDREDRARRFVRDYGLTFPAGLDSTGEAMRAYGIFAIPKTYIIGRDGAILFELSGAITEKMLSDELDRHLGGA